MCCHSGMQASFASGSIRTACDLRTGGRGNGGIESRSTLAGVKLYHFHRACDSITRCEHSM